MTRVTMRDIQTQIEHLSEKFGTVISDHKIVSEKVKLLETRMTNAEESLAIVSASAKEAAENSAIIISLMKQAKGMGGFIVKHGPRIIAFGVGIMTAAGIGNPQINSFVAGFFGG